MQRRRKISGNVTLEARNGVVIFTRNGMTTRYKGRVGVLEGDVLFIDGKIATPDDERILRDPYNGIVSPRLLAQMAREIFIFDSACAKLDEETAKKNKNTPEEMDSNDSLAFKRK